MAQSSTLFIGMDVHKDSIAVAYGAQEPHAEVISLGAIGTRQCDIDSSSGKCRPKAHSWSLSMKRGRVGSGSIAISPKKAMSAGWWRPR